MRKGIFIFLVNLCVFSLLSTEAPVFAGAKETYKGKLAPRNIQLNVQSGTVSGEGKDFQSYDAKQEAVYGNRPEAPSVTDAYKYAVYSTNYKVALDGDIADIKGTVDFEVFSKGRVKIPLVKNYEVGLIEVSINRGASFVVSEDDMYYLMIERPGKYKLDLEYLIKVQREREGGPGEFQFETMPSPISEFEFTIGETQTEVFVEPSIKVETKEEAGKTVAWAIMPMTENISVRWTKALPKETIAPVKLEPKIYSAVYTFASVGEGVLRCNAIVNYSILQSEISGVRLILPEDTNVLEVKAAELRDWKVSKEQGQQMLDVYFRFGVKGDYNLDLTFERAIGEGSVVAQIPVVKPVGVERNKGFIGVASTSNVELTVNKLERATAIDVKELPPSIWDRTANPILLAFKYLNDDYNIQLEVTKHEEIAVLVAAIDSANYVTLNTDEGKSLTKAVYQVRNNVKQFLKLNLPGDAALWSASVSGVPVKPAKDKEGHILIPLEKSQFRGAALTQIPVEIVYLEKGAKMGIMGSLKMDLPKTDLPTNELYWSAFLPKDFVYFGFGGDIKKTEEPGVLQTVMAPLEEGVKRAGLKSEIYQNQRMLEQDTLEKATQKGALPIKIDVPQQGKAYRFSKLLVTENESPHLSVIYTAIFRGTGKILLLVFIVIIVFVVRRVLKGKR